MTKQARTTRKDVTNQAIRYAHALHAATGILPEWVLEPGNTTNGIAWKFYLLDVPGGHGHIGRTPREAMLCLAARAEGLEMAAAFK